MGQREVAVVGGTLGRRDLGTSDDTVGAGLGLGFVCLRWRIRAVGGYYQRMRVDEERTFVEREV
jgi:hypothetical protein